MKSQLLAAILIISLCPISSCSGKQPKGTGQNGEQTVTDAGPADENKEEVVSAQSRIKEWLGTDLTERVSGLGKDMGKKIGQQLSGDAEVMGKAKSLSKSVFADPTVKKELKKISDKATAGLGNKLSLGWKALQAGGIDAYKKKVSADATRVAVDVLGQHIKHVMLKDDRMAGLLKEVSPALKMQGKIVAAGVQENLSARVTKKILAIVLRIASNTSGEMAQRVEKWIERCDDHAGNEVEKLIVAFSELDSVKVAVKNLAIEVMGHQRTKNELTTMTTNLVKDPEVHRTLVKVYEAAAFDKGDSAIRNALLKTIALPQVNEQLFTTMERLATAEGASNIIGKHVGTATENPDLADMVEDFVMSVLEGCGDPTEDAN